MEVAGDRTASTVEQEKQKPKKKRNRSSLPTINSLPEPDYDTDCWRTPLYVFMWVLSMYSIDADAAATVYNKLCDVYFEDGLATAWHAVASMVWCNPPYSALDEWIRKAARESHLGCGSVLLVPAFNGTVRWRDSVIGVAETVWLITGRIAFIHPTKDDVSNPAPFVSCFVVYPRNPEKRRITTVLEEISVTEMKEKFGEPSVIKKMRALAGQ